MEHHALWAAIERLAQNNGLSCSGLAKISGLDATTFNKSKQFSPDGAPRWPSCGTVAKIMIATDTTPIEFAELIMQEL